MACERRSDSPCIPSPLWRPPSRTAQQIRLRLRSDVPPLVSDIPRGIRIIDLGPVDANRILIVDADHVIEGVPLQLTGR